MSNAFLGIGTKLYYDTYGLNLITSATKAAQCVIGVDDIGDIVDDMIIYIEDVVGMVELNGNLYKVANATSTTFEILTPGDVAIDSTLYGDWVSGGEITLVDEDEIWAELGEINDIVPVSPTKETVDTTHMGSTDFYREFISGLKDGGEASFQMNFGYIGYSAIKRKFERDLSPKRWKIVLPDDVANPTTWKFDAIVTDIPPNVPTADKVVADVTLKVSGSSSFDQTG